MLLRSLPIAAGIPGEHAKLLVLNLGEPIEAFERYRVSTAAGNVCSQGPELIEPISEPGQQGRLTL